MFEIRALTCGYDKKIVLKDINLRIDNMDITGIIGPNGSGKTTLLRAMSGGLKAEKGKVFLEGRDVSRMGKGELAKKIAVVSQNFEPGGMSVEEFVLLGRIPHFGRFQFLETEKDLRIAARCMESTGIFSLRKEMLSEISGGERQLALIAKALVQEPKLLLLDEPTAHLDIAHQVKILDLISRLNKELTLTVVMVMHDLNSAGEYCQKLVLINGGRVHKTGTPSEVLTYQIIEEVYKTVVVVEKNPVSSKPYVLTISEKERKREKDEYKG